MSRIEFSTAERAAVVRRIRLYFQEELQQDIGQFDAEFLLEFITHELGPYFYNRGLCDAQAVLEKRIESVADAIVELERPTEFAR
jgi:uncharacterized protein (DUF2164 family)